MVPASLRSTSRRRGAPHGGAVRSAQPGATLAATVPAARRASLPARLLTDQIPPAPCRAAALCAAQVNNCVGQNNQKHFILFLTYTLSLATYALTMLGIRAVCTVSALDRLSTRNRPAALLRPLAGSGGRYAAMGGADDAGPVFVNCLLFFEVRRGARVGHRGCCGRACHLAPSSRIRVQAQHG